MAALRVLPAGCFAARKISSLRVLTSVWSHKAPQCKSILCPKYFSVSHCLSSSAKGEEEIKEAVKAAQPDEVTKAEEVKRETFIPITRHSLVQYLLLEKNFLNEFELKKYEPFAMALDVAVVNRYHYLLEEMKVLFDPINPDKDTVKTRQWKRRERLDNEFWLLQKMARVMEKANFRELPRSEVERALAQHSTQEGIMVSVNLDKYDILRVWALGNEIPPVKIPLYKTLFYKMIKKELPKPIEFYKRAVVAVRLKTDDKLMLKAFKEVPVNALEQLLPDGQVVMSKLDRGIITGSVALAATGALAKVVSYLAQIHMDWTLLVTLVTGAIAVRAWTAYKNKRNAYLLELSRVLYFKNIANNRGLLSLLVDRAEDELFKELLLTYTFLLTARPPSVAEKPMEEQSSNELGGLSVTILEDRINDWVFKKTGQHIAFEASEAVELLKSYGIATEDYEKNLFVTPLMTAIRNLPLARGSTELVTREYEAVEGYEYERDIYKETDEDYKKEEKKRRRFGWF